MKWRELPLPSRSGAEVKESLIKLGETGTGEPIFFMIVFRHVRLELVGKKPITRTGNRLFSNQLLRWQSAGGLGTN